MLIIFRVSGALEKIGVVTRGDKASAVTKYSSNEYRVTWARHKYKISDGLNDFPAVSKEKLVNYDVSPSNIIPTESGQENFKRNFPAPELGVRYKIVGRLLKNHAERGGEPIYVFEIGRILKEQ